MNLKKHIFIQRLNLNDSHSKFYDSFFVYKGELNYNN